MSEFVGIKGWLLRYNLLKTLQRFGITKQIPKYIIGTKKVLDNDVQDS